MSGIRKLVVIVAAVLIGAHPYCPAQEDPSLKAAEGRPHPSPHPNQMLHQQGTKIVDEQVVTRPALPRWQETPTILGASRNLHASERGLMLQVVMSMFP